VPLTFGIIAAMGNGSKQGLNRFANINSQPKAYRDEDLILHRLGAGDIVQCGVSRVA
jgi:hypothetical protein